ncbi:MAG: DUF167 domain-containing protein [Rickettsiales bacterium]|jgi:uncharacterized protein YggU (UPF0235/DUF167 family)|nr:DUF167 domain-containing protein [Rickettsiales bacterium]
MIYNIRVITSAKRNKVELPKVWTTAAPSDGKANKAVVEQLSDYLGIPKSRIKLLRGGTNRDKVFMISDHRFA